MVRVRILYPSGLREHARRVATAFKHPEINVELVPGNVDEIIVEGPTFATTDVTRATALLRRYILYIARKGERG